MSQNHKRISRRTFLARSTSLAVGASVLGTSGSRSAAPLAAVSYGRVLGANDRISLGHVGVGNGRAPEPWFFRPQSEEVR